VLDNFDRIEQPIANLCGERHEQVRIALLCVRPWRRSRRRRRAGSENASSGLGGASAAALPSSAWAKMPAVQFGNSCA
jgi:hypothetical protein